MASQNQATEYQSWHSDQTFGGAIDNFSKNEAQSPDLKCAGNWNTRIIKDIQEKLKAKSIFFTPEFVGSAFEGLKVKGDPDKKDDIEFDVMIVCDLEDSLTTESTGLPNYKLVKCMKETFPKRTNKNGYLLPASVANEFFGKVQTCVNAMDFLQRKNMKIILRKHGPAIQMDVYKPRTAFFYCVDIVPAIKIGNEYFVAKELKLNVGETVALDLKPLTWRISYSLDEKEKLRRLNNENENRTKLLRVLKSIRNNDSTLKYLTSYHLKNTLLNVCDKFPRPSQWSDEHKGERFIDLVKELEVCLANRNLPCNFQPDVNLLEGMNDGTLEQLRNRCKRMINSEVLMNHLLAASKNP